MEKDKEYHLHNGMTGAALAIRVTPRASHNEVSEILDDGTVKIRLTSTGTAQSTNQVLLQFLSKILEVPANLIEIVAGQSGNDKLVTVLNIDSNTVHKRIIKQLGQEL